MDHTLPAPPVPAGLPHSAQWLAGEGAGSWFVLKTEADTPNLIHMERRDPHGHMECRGIFLRDNTSERFDLNAPYSVTYPSHCARITALQNGQVFTLLPIPEELIH